MSNKELLKQLEMEKQRRGMSRAKPMAEPVEHKPYSSEHRYAWEYELEAYRSQKRKMRWLTAGALCGVLSLALELGFHWSSIAALGRFWPFK